MGLAGYFFGTERVHKSADPETDSFWGVAVGSGYGGSKVAASCEFRNEAEKEGDETGS